MISAAIAAAVMACLSPQDHRALSDDQELQSRIAEYMRKDVQKMIRERDAFSKAGLVYSDAWYLADQQADAIKYQAVADAEAHVLAKLPVCRP